MAVFEEDFYTFLSDSGTDAGSRFYPNSLPQGVVLPAVRYFLVSDPPERTHSGPSKLRHPRYQLDCVADGDDGYLNAKKLASQIIAIIDGYKGPMGSYTCHVGFRDEMRDNYDPETGRHTVQLDVILWHDTP